MINFSYFALQKHRFSGCLSVVICFIFQGSVASFLAASNNLAEEEGILVKAVQFVLLTRMARAKDESRLRTLMRDIFPSSIRHIAGKDQLNKVIAKAVADQLLHNNFCATTSFVNKVRPVLLLTLTVGILSFFL